MSGMKDKVRTVYRLILAHKVRAVSETSHFRNRNYYEIRVGHFTYICSLYPRRKRES